MHKIGVITSIHPRDDSRINAKTCASLSKKYKTHLIVFDGLGNDFSGKFQIHDAKDNNLFTRLYDFRLYKSLFTTKHRIFRYFHPFTKTFNRYEWLKKIHKTLKSYKFYSKKRIGNKFNSDSLKNFINILKPNLIKKSIQLLFSLLSSFLKLINNVVYFFFRFLYLIFITVNNVVYFFFRFLYLIFITVNNLGILLLTITFSFIGIIIRGIYKFPYDIFYRSFSIYKVIKPLNLELFHLHDPELIYLGIFLKLKGKKVIYDSHESFPKQILGKVYVRNKISNIILTKFVSSLAYINEYIFLRFFDGLIAATPKIQTEIIKINPVCEVINNYVIANEINQSSITSSSNQIVYIGSVSVIKGVGDNVMMMKYLPQKINFDIVGRVSTAMLPLLRGNNSKRIKFHGKVSRDKLEPFFKNAFVGLCLFHPVPNYIEAQPIKLYEYMAAGIPVIVSDFPLWKKFIQDNKCGFFVPSSKPMEAAKIISKLYKDKKLAKELGNNARKAVVTRYNWSMEEIKLLAFYKNILN